MSTTELPKPADTKNVQLSIVNEQPKTTVIDTIMVHEEVPVKKYCSTMKENVHIACKCCAYTWCFSLNSIECCCVSLSKICILLSDAALCCNKALEEIDCDTH